MIIDEKYHCYTMNQKENSLSNSFIPLIEMIFFYEDKSFPQREFFGLPP